MTATSIPTRHKARVGFPGAAVRVPQISTARLDLRDWGQDLAGPDRTALEHDMARILTPTVLRGFPQAARDMSHGLRGWIDRQSDLCHGLTIRPKGSRSTIGLVLLYPDPPETLHLGYLLGQLHWGKGLATEAIHALLQHLRPHAPLTLRATVAIDNPASLRVLHKSGFHPDTGQDVPGLHRLVLKIAADR